MVENLDYYLLTFSLFKGENLLEGEVDFDPDLDPDLEEEPGDIIFTNFIKLSPNIFKNINKYILVYIVG